MTYQHYSGRRFPLAEIAEYEDETYSFEYSFLDRAEAMAVRELLGKIVAVKTAHDECYVGDWRQCRTARIGLRPTLRLPCVRSTTRT